MFQVTSIYFTLTCCNTVLWSTALRCSISSNNSSQGSSLRKYFSPLSTHLSLLKVLHNTPFPVQIFLSSNQTLHKLITLMHVIISALCSRRHNTTTEIGWDGVAESTGGWLHSKKIFPNDKFDTRMRFPFTATILLWILGPLFRSIWMHVCVHTK